MSQRLAMILALALTLVLGTGVYAARGRVIGTQSTQVQQEDVEIPATEITTPDTVISRQNPPAVPPSGNPATTLEESTAEAGSGTYAEDDAEHDDDEDTAGHDSDDRDEHDSDHEEDDDD